MPERIGRVIGKASQAVEAVAESSGNRLRWSTKNTMGGLIVSTLFTLFVVPTFFRFALAFSGVFLRSK